MPARLAPTLPALPFTALTLKLSPSMSLSLLRTLPLVLGVTSSCTAATSATATGASFAPEVEPPTALVGATSKIAGCRVLTSFPVSMF